MYIRTCNATCNYNFDGPSAQARLIITLLLAPPNIVLAIAVFWKMGILLFDSLGANPVLHSELCSLVGTVPTLGHYWGVVSTWCTYVCGLYGTWCTYVCGLYGTWCTYVRMWSVWYMVYICGLYGTWCTCVSYTIHCVHVCCTYVVCMVHGVHVCPIQYIVYMCGL